MALLPRLSLHIDRGGYTIPDNHSEKKLKLKHRDIQRFPDTDKGVGEPLPDCVSPVTYATT